jgi:hypothetical protein
VWFACPPTRRTVRYRSLPSWGPVPNGCGRRRSAPYRRTGADRVEVGPVIDATAVRMPPAPRIFQVHATSSPPSRNASRS